MLRSFLRGALTYWRGKRRNLVIFGLRLLYKTKIKLVILQEEEFASIGKVRDAIVRIGGKSAFRRIRKLIRKSRVSIVIQVFIWKNDNTGRSIAKLLIDAAMRGVQIHIMKDSLGDMFEYDASLNDTRSLNDPLWKEFWSQQNITVDLRSGSDHSKIWVFDGRIVLVSGMNIGNEYEHEWHDFLVELRGEKFAEQVLQRRTDTSRKNESIQIIVNSEKELAVRLSVMNLLRTARKKIIVEHCYLTDTVILQELAKATKRGIDVTVITPKDPDVNAMSNLASLEILERESDRKKLQILQYPSMFHSKVLLVDGNRCLIGSANFNELSLSRTGETCALFTGETKGAKKIARRLRIDVLKSKILSVPKLAVFSKFLARIGL